MSKGNSNYGKTRLEELFKSKDVRVHFLGIGGVSMSALAELMHLSGYAVSGSDEVLGSRVKRLASMGIPVSHISEPKLLLESRVAVYTLAIPEDSPAFKAAERAGIPLVSRAELLGFLSLGYRHRIGVSGSHGKSTTTAMVAAILKYLELSPTVLSGVELGDSSLVMGERDFLVYEACEYRDSFLSMLPTVAVATNIELDHTDYFSSLEALCTSFRLSLERAEVAVVNSDDVNSHALLSIPASVSFGKAPRADFGYSTPIHTRDGMRFTITHKGESINVRLPSFAPHDAANATAAVAAVCSSGIDFSRLDGCLDSFRGVGRRCELLRYIFSRPVYYDYAHHPTEIESTLRAVRDKHGACTVIFRPHTYSRTRDLWDGFVRALSLADFAVLVDIYAARELPIEGVDSRALARAVGGVYLPSGSVADYVVNNCVGAIVLMGAGDVEDIKKALEEY